MEKLDKEFVMIPDTRTNIDYIRDDEICVKDQSDNKLYARKFRNIKSGECEIKDRPIKVVYHEEIIDDKKVITYDYL